MITFSAYFKLKDIEPIKTKEAPNGKTIYFYSFETFKDYQTAVKKSMEGRDEHINRD